MGFLMGEPPDCVVTRIDQSTGEVLGVDGCSVVDDHAQRRPIRLCHVYTWTGGLGGFVERAAGPVEGLRQRLGACMVAVADMWGRRRSLSSASLGEAFWGPTQSLGDLLQCLDLHDSDRSGTSGAVSRAGSLLVHRRRHAPPSHCGQAWLVPWPYSSAPNRFMASDSDTGPNCCRDFRPQGTNP